jgi:peroxiredoxin Q/BCP
MLQTGDPFPDFDLPDQDGKRHTKADLSGAPAIVFFYPKDDTSG